MCRFHLAAVCLEHQDWQSHWVVVRWLQVAPEGGYCLTSSKDKTAKIIDMQSLKVIRTYTHTRPVNSAAMSPLDHVRSRPLLCGATAFLALDIQP